MNTEDATLQAKVDEILSEIKVLNPLAKFNLRFRTEWSKQGNLTLVLLRHVMCVEDYLDRDFKMTADVDPQHPEAVRGLDVYIMTLARDLVARAMIHEVDECLRRDGAPLVDPHPNNDFSVKGTYVKWPLLSPR